MKKSKFIPESEKKPPPKKEVLGLIGIEIFTDNTYNFILPINKQGQLKINPEFIRGKLNELVNHINDNIVINKIINLQNKAKVLDANGRPIMTINKDPN